MSNRRVPPPPALPSLDLAPPPGHISSDEFGEQLQGLPADEELQVRQPAPPPPQPASAAENFGRIFQAATGDLDDIQLVDLAGDEVVDEQKAPEPPPAQETAVQAREKAPTKPEPTARGGSTAAASAAPDPVAPAGAGHSGTRSGDFEPELDAELGLELDFGKAGISPQQKGQSAPGPISAPPEPGHPAARNGSSAQMPVAADSRSRARGDSNERSGLFGADPVLNVLLAAAIGLVLGLYPGLEGADRLERSVVAPLLAELSGSVERPLAADAGEVRKPSAITGEIDAAHARVRGRFFTFWLGAALPVALGLSLVRRRA